MSKSIAASLAVLLIGAAPHLEESFKRILETHDPTAQVLLFIEASVSPLPGGLAIRIGSATCLFKVDRRPDPESPLDASPTECEPQRPALDALVSDDEA